MTTYAALLRGINVGKAKRIAMADLRQLVERAGFTAPQTLLNSGNVVFSGSRQAPEAIATTLEAAIEATVGFRSNVIVVTADTLDTVVKENAFAETCDNPSRLQIAFVRTPDVLSSLAPLSAADWGTERIAVGSRAAYLWCPNGVLDGKLIEAAGRALADRTTMRNWATVLKLQQMMGDR